MPLYSYECPDCGIFSALRSMTDSGDPASCPDCGAQSLRSLATPMLRGSVGSAPASPGVPRHSGGHSAGCNCCRPQRRSFGMHR